MKKTRLARILPLALAALDSAWAFSALQTSAPSSAAATVPMLNMVVWIFLHLPAAFLGSLPWSGLPEDAPIPQAQILLIGLLGVLQAAAIGWWWGLRLDSRAKGRA